jgi:hypothetical protein
LHCSAVHSRIKEPCFSNKCKTMSCIKPEVHLQWQPNSIFQASLERKVSDEEQFSSIMLEFCVEGQEYRQDRSWGRLVSSVVKSF